ncbi:MAG: DUF3662 and FHA domain-containing protein [Acidimicrobiia bacterium]|nr:DUF3662 and FHA domain-containing protein [Acidimicrobiia bacterium]
MGITGFERRLERLVEGTFARLFRSGLRPVEIGRRLTREMDGDRSVAVDGTVLVPNDFTVHLSDEDHDQFSEIHGTLERELGDAAREHARDERYRFMGPVRVHLEADLSVRTGSFSIVARMKEGEGGVGAGSLVLPSGERWELQNEVVTIGRLPECAITVEDRNVSRHHAEIRPSGEGFAVVDLGSTNGTKVGGAAIRRHELRDGDDITVGNVRLRFEAS